MYGVLLRSLAYCSYGGRATCLHNACYHTLLFAAAIGDLCGCLPGRLVAPAPTVPELNQQETPSKRQTGQQGSKQAAAPLVDPNVQVMTVTVHQTGCYEAVSTVALCIRLFIYSAHR